MKYKKLSSKHQDKIEHRICFLLAAGLDYCRNACKDKQWWFNPFNPYYCEAFGMLQTLECLGYGYFGADNIDSEGNLRYWFNQLKSIVAKMGDEMGEHETYAYFVNNTTLPKGQ